MICRGSVGTSSSEPPRGSSAIGELVYTSPESLKATSPSLILHQSFGCTERKSLIVQRDRIKFHNLQVQNITNSDSCCGKSIYRMNLLSQHNKRIAEMLTLLYCAAAFLFDPRPLFFSTTTFSCSIPFLQRKSIIQSAIKRSFPQLQIHLRKVYENIQL